MAAIGPQVDYKRQTKSRVASDRIFARFDSKPTNPQIEMKFLLCLALVGMLATAYATILTAPVVYGNTWGTLGGLRYSGLSSSAYVVPSVYSRPLVSTYSHVPISSYGVGLNSHLVGLNYGLGLRRNTILDYI